MRKKQWSVDWALKRLMLVTGLVLSLSLAGKWIQTWNRTGENGIWQVSGKEWLAQGLALWIRKSGPAENKEEIRQFSENWSLKKEEQESMSQWIGRNIALSMAKQSPLLCFLGLKAELEETPVLDADPSYSHYLAGQRVMKESSYMLLFGDENSLAGNADIRPGAEAGRWPGDGAGTEQENGPGSASGTEQGNGPGSASGTEPGPASLAGQTSGGSAADITIDEMACLTPAYHIRKQPVTGTEYMLEQLADYDFLMKHFYSVHSSTTASREEMNAETLLGIDLSIEKDAGQPQILIYHTHSQETYADYGPDRPEANVLGIGNYLTELLTQKGYQVIHDTTVYDVIDGKLDRNHAYNYALDGITGILQKYPSIEVVLDLHRDGVKESLHMVSQVNGKATAPIMFFNGMSQTPEGPIEYLQNPYKEENLAFSLQMQLDAAAYFPGLTRKIYLKGLRYNLHLRPRSALIEVGAQTNTYEEARNAMEPLAELLDMVLSGE